MTRTNHTLLLPCRQIYDLLQWQHQAVLPTQGLAQDLIRPFGRLNLVAEKVDSFPDSFTEDDMAQDPQVFQKRIFLMPTILSQLSIRD
ncbi:BZ3500_MvSof-1268-A1-R1_Chr9g10579 [Microbotryum saponariae]|uniref:BZ3500_MvSof-1268-A1-R1_Chr9g10579 protein n=1 Tax=Microbotryum saponariae TaxID=289078 RepID=A0A2X0L617_9BASI|nr:BZ3501_MvSof-1269-A2-R1_Chr9g10327 [Microbotryum saponariae]SDA00330.1 BZ3500_MvSof-1268-A1-R1_Chr9g10579 [Microbotryum saponariae]